MASPWVHMFYIGLYREKHELILFHMFYIGLYREKHETIFLSETKMPRALIFGMKHHLVNLYKGCSNYISGAKNDPIPGVMFYIGQYCEKHEKIFLSETIRLRALILGMKHHLVDPFQVCSNSALGTKNGLPKVSLVVEQTRAQKSPPLGLLSALSVNK